MGLEQEAATQGQPESVSVSEGVEALLGNLATSQPGDGAETLPEGDEQAAEPTAAEIDDDNPDEGAETLPEEGEGDDEAGEGESEDSQSGETVAGDTVTLAELAAELEVDPADLESVTVPIKIDGKEQTATIGDLIKGHQLEGATRARLESAATAEKEAAGARDAYKQALDQRFQQIDQVVTMLGAQVQVIGNPLQGLDPEADPGAYLQAKEAHENNQRLIQAALIEQQNLAAQHAEIQQAEYREWVKAEEGKLPDLVPAWRDAEAMKAGKAAGGELLASLGFSADEIANLHDARMWAVVELAASGKAVSKKAQKAAKDMQRGTLRGRIRGKGRGTPAGKQRALRAKAAKQAGGGTLDTATESLLTLMRAIDGDE